MLKINNRLSDVSSPLRSDSVYEVTFGDESGDNIALTLVRGKIYNITVDSNCFPEHPLCIRTSTGGDYEGAEPNCIADGSIILDIPEDEDDVWLIFD